jgi:hypothetical protein
MATQLTKSIDEATDKVVSLVEQAQDAAIAVVAQVSETVAQYVPELGLGEVVLHPEDAVDSSFRTGNKFVDAGRKAALGFVGAVAPVTDKIFGARKKPATKSA